MPAGGVPGAPSMPSTGPFKKQESIIQIMDQDKCMREYKEANDAEGHPHNPAVLTSMLPLASGEGIGVLTEPGQIYHGEVAGHIQSRPVQFIPTDGGDQPGHAQRQPEPGGKIDLERRWGLDPPKRSHQDRLCDQHGRITLPERLLLYV